MISKTLTINNKVGIHARPASLLIETAKKFTCEKTFAIGEKSSDLKGIISLLKLQAKCGDVVTISTSGEDEEACLTALSDLIESKFGED